jgi:molecular chaperone HtpG
LPHRCQSGLYAKSQASRRSDRHTSDKEKYAQFIAEYNRPLKEGLYGDYANRETLLDLVRFKSTKVEGMISLAEAKERMQPEQKSLYYVTGGSESMLRNSPLLEIYKKKGIEVLILDDDIDEIVFSSVPKYGDIDLKAVNKSTTGDDLKDDSTPEKAEELKPLLERFKAKLGDAVKEVRASSRLADSPSVIVSDEDEPSARMRHMMRAMGRKEIPDPVPTLEINPDHEIIRKLLADPSNSKVEDAAWLLFDQALLLEGVPLKDPATFVQRLNRVLNQSI